MGVRFKCRLWDSEVFGYHEFSTACLPVEDKYAVKISIIGLFKSIGNEGNVIMAAYGIRKCGL